MIATLTIMNRPAAMKILVAAAALAAFVASPWDTASAQTPAAKQASEKKKPPATPKPNTQRSSPYSSNPEYDVYVDGEYAGSDPDPLVRWQLRREGTGRVRRD